MGKDRRHVYGVFNFLRTKKEERKTEKGMSRKTRTIAMATGMLLSVGLISFAEEGIRSAAAADRTEEARKELVEEFWARIDKIEGTKSRNIRWGKEKRATRSNTIILKRPLTTSVNSLTAQVEWFVHPISANATSRGWTATRTLVWNYWTPSIIEDGKTQFLVLERTISEGPGVNKEHADAARMMHYLWLGAGWYVEQNRVEEARGLIDALNMARGTSTTWLDTEEEVKELVERSRLDWKQWKSNVDEYTHKYMQEDNERWKNVAQQALEQSPKVFDIMPQPMLLIDGKYLITYNTSAQQGARKAPQRVFHIANWLIRTENERKMRHLITPGEFLWGNERKPKRGEMLKFRQAHEDRVPEKVDVEWLYSYTSGDGRHSKFRWQNDRVEEWLASVRKAGITRVNLIKTPVGQWTQKKSEWTRQQKLHQEMVMGWSEYQWEAAYDTHMEMWKTLRRDPKGVSTETQAQRIIAATGHDHALWQKSRKTKKNQERMAKATDRALATGRKSPEPEGPVFVVDGQYRIDARSAGNATKAFQILNWIVRKRIGERASERKIKKAKISWGN